MLCGAWQQLTACSPKLPRRLSVQAHNQEATFLQANNSLGEFVNNHILPDYSPELAIHFNQLQELRLLITSILFAHSPNLSHVSTNLNFQNLNVSNESVAMDVPEPDQTPFNAVQAQTSKLARVSASPRRSAAITIQESTRALCS